MNFNLDNKSFVLLNNSEEGTVDQATVFHYNQNGNLVKAEYHGGQILWGTIVGELIRDKMKMLYQCMTVDGELKAGQAFAKLSWHANKKIRLDLEWKWLGDHTGKGTSIYLEKH